MEILHILRFPRTSSLVPQQSEARSTYMRSRVVLRRLLLEKTRTMCATCMNTLGMRRHVATCTKRERERKFNMQNFLISFFGEFKILVLTVKHRQREALLRLRESVRMSKCSHIHPE